MEAAREEAALEAAMAAAREAAREAAGMEAAREAAETEAAAMEAAMEAAAREAAALAEAMAAAMAAGGVLVAPVVATARGDLGAVAAAQSTERMPFPHGRSRRAQTVRESSTTFYEDRGSDSFSMTGSFG